MVTNLLCVYLISDGDDNVSIVCLSDTQGCPVLCDGEQCVHGQVTVVDNKTPTFFAPDTKNNVIKHLSTSCDSRTRYDLLSIYSV